MPKRIPKFIIIGEQKCGTTSLNRSLGKHPKIFTPYREVHYFDRLYQPNTKWYSNIFNDASKNEICGEKTPNYFFFPECVDRMKKDIPDCKFILMLRDPVQRAISYFKSNGQLYGKGFNESVINGIRFIGPTCTLKTYDALHFIERGFYCNSLKYFLSKFNKDQLAVVILERFKKEPRKHLNYIQNFIGVKKHGIPVLKINTAKRKLIVDKDTEQYLYNFYQPYNEKLFKLLGYDIPEWNYNG